jgi:rubredoxin
MTESFIRYKCERCGWVEEVASKMPMMRSIFDVGKPKGWEKVSGALLCNNCVTAFKTAFRAFLREGGQHEGKCKRSSS